MIKKTDFPNIPRREYACLLGDNALYRDSNDYYWEHTFAYKPNDGWLGCTWCSHRERCVQDTETPKQMTLTELIKRRTP